MSLKTVASSVGGGGNGTGTVTNVSTGTGLTGGPITTTGTISLANTTVTAESYGNASIVGTFTVDAQGRLTSASNTAIAISVLAVSGAVPNTVNVIAGTGLTGGGALTGNVTLTVAANTTQQLVTVQNNGVAVGTRQIVNFLAGTNITVTTADDAANGRANVTIATSGLGTMATQNANNIAVTGGSINGTTIGATTASTGAFTNVSATNVAATTFTSGAWNGTAIGPTYGGTGQTAVATGDIIYGSALNTWSRLAAGTNGYVLTLSGGVPTWAASTGGVTSFQTSLSGLTPSTSSTGAITLAGTLGVSSGGTGVTTSTGSGNTVLSTSPTLTTPAINGFTGDTSVINVGSGQLYKDTSGNVGIGTSSSSARFSVNGGTGTAQTRFEVATTEVQEVATNAAQSAYANRLTDAAQHIWKITGSERMRIDTSGGVGIGTSSPSASAILDAQSTTKGVRFPNMTTTQKNAISSPVAGLVVFDTTLAKLCVYSGSAWQTVTSV